MSSSWRQIAGEVAGSTRYLLVLGLGILAGVAILLLSQEKVLWIIYILLALFGLVFVLSFPDKRRLLYTVFILSMQVEVYLRLLYGRAEGEGLAIPMVVLTGGALTAWYAGTGRLKYFRFGGTMSGPIIAMFVTTFLSILTTSERFIGLAYLLSLAEYYFLYWLSYNLVHSEEDFRSFVKLLLVVLAMQSVVYYIQSGLGVTFDLSGQTWDAGEIPRPGGTVSANPAGFASFIMPALFMAVTMAIVKPRVWSRKYAVIVSLMGLLALLLTFTRGAWSGFLFGMVVVVYIGLRARVISGKTVFIAAALVVIAILAFTPVMLERVAMDYSGQSGSESTLEERLGLIQIALNIIAAHPITGIGPGSYGYLFKSYMPGGIDQWVFVVHNEFLLQAAEIGIPGAIAFVAFLVAGFRVARRLVRGGFTLVGVCALGWIGALVTLIWQMSWVPWIGWSYNAMLWVMLGLMDAAQRLVVRQEPVGGSALPVIR